jgi:hypothetical protein
MTRTSKSRSLAVCLSTIFTSRPGSFSVVCSDMFLPLSHLTQHPQCRHGRPIFPGFRASSSRAPFRKRFVVKELPATGPAPHRLLYGTMKNSGQQPSFLIFPWYLRASLLRPCRRSRLNREYGHSVIHCRPPCSFSLTHPPNSFSMIRKRLKSCTVTKTINKSSARKPT